MEERLKLKWEEINKALKNFEDSLSIQKSLFPEIVADSIESGQIQKFEFCTELLWKFLKLYLNQVEGIDVKSPKKVIKEFFALQYISYEDYELLIQMVDDRNSLSHIYKKELFKKILDKLPQYNKVMEKVVLIISENI